MESWDNAAWDNQEGVEVPTDLPQPQLWRVLVFPMKPQEVSKGGIVIASQAQENQRHLNYVGKVVRMGPLAGHSEKFSLGNLNGFAVKEGDYVIYGRYAGQPLEYKGARLLIVNDDEILATVADPQALRIHV